MYRYPMFVRTSDGSEGILDSISDGSEELQEGSKFFSSFASIIMVAITCGMEVTSSIPAAKMFKAFVLDCDNLIPKILPAAIKGSEIVEGEGLEASS
ncbi:hypothetical protein RJ640_022063 [Escallonia rubra]|uniref:Uncharacterized protein n=1 Tax=Escallonia rubra TaxID=112253 RepID=A0AA88U8P6_9ASTE|nr:hypothetical protein RJ640_022063 [Escallonia rubra]